MWEDQCEPVRDKGDGCLILQCVYVERKLRGWEPILPPRVWRISTVRCCEERIERVGTLSIRVSISIWRAQFLVELQGRCICHWEPDKDQLALLLKDRNERENADLIR
ncbi:hypothetical protein COLO4_24301 [Corchorus olitorius]|uniref:Uncharacterized protein n=1 Tax=Corchorus olitorius TaxID=93759 RepID=A0A1R3IBE0_9ROSI|nr:hypothetical protein COLO4_24301 [Corchorus olitorius]